METYVRNEIKLKRQDSIRAVGNDINLYLKTLDESTDRDLTMNYSSSDTTTKLYGHSELVTRSRMMYFSLIQKFGTNYSRSETKHTVMNIPLLRFKTDLSSRNRTRLGLAVLELRQAESLMPSLLY